MQGRRRGTRPASAVDVATFGHLAAGVALSRLVGVVDRGRPASWTDATVLAVAAEAPDVDFLLPLRHRGITHSAGFAVAVGAGLAAAYAPSGWRRGLAMGFLGALATLSHAALDLATGESGTEAAWPATDENLSLPAAPLPATPIGRQLLTSQGLLQALGEAAWAAPLALIGLWPFRSGAR